MIEITYSSVTDEELSRETVQEATKGNDIYLTIDMDLQQEAYDILFEKVKSLLIDKITGISSSDGSSYTAGDVLISLMDNGYFDPDQLLTVEGAYGESFCTAYEQMSQSAVSQLRSAIMDQDLLIREYSDDLSQIYNAWIEIMRDAEGVLSHEYQNAGAFYEEYAAGEKSAYEFLEYCIYNNILDLEQFGLEHEMDVEVIIQSFLDQEFENLLDNNAFQEIIYERILADGMFSEENLCCFCRMLRFLAVTMEVAAVC